jgi:putative component of membrane protein insertase Oxa1/YidC/SpoIIIJ protein YidD
MIMLSKAFVLAVRLYQMVGSPVMRWRGVCCLRTPTCSEYAILALKKYPLRIALRMTRERVLDCRFGGFRSFIDYP